VKRKQEFELLKDEVDELYEANDELARKVSAFFMSRQCAALTQKLEERETELEMLKSQQSRGGQMQNQAALLKTMLSLNSGVVRPHGIQVSNTLSNPLINQNSTQINKF